MPTKTLDEFLSTYAPPERPIIEVECPEMGSEGMSPFIIVRDTAGRVIVLNPILGGANCDHLCVDAHAFLNGQDAALGVFGMDSDVRGQQELSGALRTSHGWKAAGTVALLLGAQGVVSDE